MLSANCTQDAVDVVGDGGALVLRASSSSVESPGFLAAYSAHVIRPPSAARRDGDSGADDGTGEHSDNGDSEAASMERWAGTAALDPAAQAIRSLQARDVEHPCAGRALHGTCIDWHVKRLVLRSGFAVSSKNAEVT